MIVQCIDGFFYQNPRFQTPLALVSFTDDGCFLYRKGNVTWKTAVRELTALGIKARNANDPTMTIITGDKIINGELVQTTEFKIKLYKPIPVPHNHQARIENPASNDEEILRFSKRQSK